MGKKEKNENENTVEPEKKKKKHHRLRNTLLIILALLIAVLVAAVVFVSVQVGPIPALIQSHRRQSEGASQETIDSLVTRDEEGGAAIDALPDKDPTDTWAIYAYIDGSNLEGGTVDNMSELAEYIVGLDQSATENDTAKEERVETFLSEIWEKGSDLPESLYTVQASDSEWDTASSDEDETDDDPSRFGSRTIDHLTEADLPENVTVVMMTGGSYSWENPAVNPNRSQIFVYDADGFREVESDPVKNMGSGDTMAEFLAFCDENYPADHRILSIMDHGSASGGFSYDYIYKDTVSFEEFRTALESVYEADPDDPPFDIIDFDCCLMGSLEMAENVYGYTTYLVGTEEVGIGGTHDYTDYLEALAENTAIHPAKLGKLIVDGTVDNIAEMDYQTSPVSNFLAGTMSLTDVTKAHDLYSAYEDLCAAVLKDAVQDNHALTTMSRAATQNLRFGANHYNVFNQVDLGILASNLEEAYPKEAAAVLDALSEASLYRAATRFHKNATGLSVYYPVQITDLNGLNYLLNYIDQVCESEDIAALYYYSFAGCLNDEYTDYVESRGYGTPETLDTSPLDQLTYNEITAGDGANFSLTLTEEQQALIQDMSLCLVRQDDDGTLNLGEDKRLSADENGTVTSDFDGTWLAIDGRTLEADVIDAAEDTVRYKAEVNGNGKDSYLIIGEDRETCEFSLQGNYTENQDFAEGAIMANYPDELPFDTKITPVYTKVSLDDNSVTKVRGDSGKYTEDTKFGLSALDDGDYYLMIKAYDARGDEYYSAPMHFVMNNGKITDTSVSQASYAVTRE